MTTQEFLIALWGNPPPGKVLVWTLPGKTSTWYDHFDTIDEDMLRHENDEVYTGVGLAPREGVRLSRRNRLQGWDVAGTPGLWADIDVAHPVHAKSERLPPNLAQAIDAIGELPFRPSILVDSGHGLQGWWIFESPWLFSGPEERDLARRVSQWWHRTIQDVFARHEWVIDSTFDLARVMRLPGTWNNKDRRDRKPVEVVESTGERYRRETFLSLVPEDFEATPMRGRKGRSRGAREKTPSGSGLILDPEAEPSLLRMETLIEGDPLFRRTWEHNRKDLPDPSPSGYDMSLASQAIRTEWPDQEIVNLLIAFRRKHRLPPKLRLDYYEATLEKAKRPMERERLVRAALDRVTSSKTVGAGNAAGAQGEDEDGTQTVEDEGVRRAEILEALSVLFERIAVLRLESFRGRTTTYVMTTDRGTVYLDSTKDVLSQSRFIERVADGTHQVLNLKGRKVRWSDVAQLILDACVDRDMGEVTSPEIECEVWIDMYLNDRPIVEDPDDAAAERIPLLYESRIHINLNDLSQWLRTQLGITKDTHDLAQQLTRSGWTPDRKNVRVGDRRTTYRCWRSGEDYELGNE